MKAVKPLVIKIGETIVDRSALREVLNAIGVSDAGRDRFLTTHGTDGQTLVEFAGRICYESYEPGLNPNVTRIREDPSDYFKNSLTSAIRRILPDGLATNLIWTANHRTLRWVIEMRTDPSAEVEIRMVFNQIAEICIRDYPYLYGDFVTTELPDGTKSYRPKLRSKV